MDNKKKPENPKAFAAAKEYFVQHGMTLLDYFAAQAIPTLIDNFTNNGHSTANCGELVAKRAYTIANEMLKEREKYFND
jgi:hypothetical protein